MQTPASVSAIVSFTTSIVLVRVNRLAPDFFVTTQVNVPVTNNAASCNFFITHDDASCESMTAYPSSPDRLHAVTTCPVTVSGYERLNVSYSVSSGELPLIDVFDDVGYTIALTVTEVSTV